MVSILESCEPTMYGDFAGLLYLSFGIGFPAWGMYRIPQKSVYGSCINCTAANSADAVVHPRRFGRFCR
jgi:hypothetical protein